MELLIAVIVWAMFGLLVGAIARLLVPGRQPIGIAGTMAVGIIGSLVGGFIAWLFTGGEPLQWSGILLSILGAVIVLWAFVGATRRRTT